MQFRLENPAGLFAFLAVAILFALILRNRWVAPWAFTWRRLLVISLAMSTLAFSLSRPQFGRWSAGTVESRANLYVAVDISKSMMAEDVPGGRLRTVASFSRQLFASLPGMRVAIFPFAADGYMQMPLSSDLDTALDLLDMLHPSMTTSQGTDLARSMESLLEAIIRARTTAIEKEHVWSPTQVLLWSDGETHGSRIDAIAKRFRAERIPIYAVGVGTDLGGMIPQENQFGSRGYLRDEQDRPVRTKLESKSLQALSESSGGEYFPARLGLLPTIAERLVRRAEISRMTSHFKAERELGPMLVAFALLLLLVDLFFARWEYAVRAIWVAGILSLPLGGSSAMADVRDPSSAPKPAYEIYNEAIGRMELGSHKEAVELFQRAAADSKDASLRKKALYNAGNALMQLMDPTQAQEYYQQALDTRTGDKAFEADANLRISDNLVLASRLKQMMKKMAQQKGDSDENKEKNPGDDPKGPKNDYDTQEFDESEKRRLYDTISIEEQQALQRLQNRNQKKPKDGPRGKSW